MEATRLTAIIEAKDTGVAEKFQATDTALASMGQKVQDTAARAVRLTETISQQQRTLELQRASLVQVAAKFGEGSEAAERKRIAIDRLQTSLATNERRLDQTKEALARLVDAEDRSAGGWLNFDQVVTGALRHLGEMGVDALMRAGRAVVDLTGEAAQQYIAYENLEGATTALVAAELRHADSGLTMADAMAQAAGKADELLQWQSQLALNSPFGEEGIAKTFQQAEAYGFSATAAQSVAEAQQRGIVTAERLTQAVVDYAAASRRGEAGAQGVALALGQIEAKGKLSAQEMNQLAERGINAKQILADALGVTTEEFVAMQEKGLIPAKEAVAVLVESLEKDFGGAAKTAGDTFGGTIDRINELKDIGLREFFTGTAEAALPVLKELADTLSDPKIRDSVRENGQAFGRWVTDVVEGAEVIRGATANIEGWISGMVDRVGGAFDAAGERLGVERTQMLAQAGQGAMDILSLYNPATWLDMAASGIARFSGVQQEASAANAAALAGEGQAAQQTASQYAALQQLFPATSLLMNRAPAPAGGQGEAAQALRDALTASGDAKADDAAAKDLERAAQRYQEKLLDIARDGQLKRRDAEADHARKLGDLDQDAARAAEGRARDAAEKRALVVAEGARTREEAEAEGARRLADLDEGLARQREDALRDHERKLADLTQEQAQARADLAADAARANVAAEEQAAQRRADVTRDLGRQLEDAERETARKREDIGRDLAEKLTGLEESAQLRRADLAQQFADQQQALADRLADRLSQAQERTADRRAELEAQLGQATDAGAQEQIRRQIAALDAKGQAEQERLRAQTTREQQQAAERYAREQAELEAKLARDRAAAEEAAQRKREDLERDAAAEREQAQRAAERKLADQAAADERSRQQRLASQAQKLTDLLADQAAAVEAERQGYAEQLADQQLAHERKRADLLADQAQKLADLEADRQQRLTEEQAGYAASEAESRRSLAQKRADEQQSYAERLADLQQSLADRRAAEGITAERAATGDGADAAARAAQARARLQQAQQSADQAAAVAAGGGGTTIVNVAGSLFTENELRGLLARMNRRVAGSGGLYQ